jgi:hypothetical protein
MLVKFNLISITVYQCTIYTKYRRNGVSRLQSDIARISHFNWNIENCLKYNFIKLSCNWHVKSSAINTPNAYETFLYYSTVSGEHIGTSREVITELSNLIMTVIVAYEKIHLLSCNFQIYIYIFIICKRNALFH